MKAKMSVGRWSEMVKNMLEESWTEKAIGKVLSFESAFRIMLENVELVYDE